MSKPQTIDSFLLTFYTESSAKTHILNLVDIHCEFKDKMGIIEIDLPNDAPWPNECKQIIASYADDPTLEHAGGWAHLGTTRLCFILEDAKRLHHRPRLAYKGKLNLDLIIPERWPPSASFASELRI